MDESLLARSQNWTDLSKNLDTVTHSNMNNCYIHPYNYQFYYQPRPIKLTLPEVEKLRALSQEDKSVRDILMKFTPFIEVSFDI